jgi:hypothetical protein
MNFETREEMIQELAEAVTRIEGEARHLRGAIERLRRRLEADRAAQAGGESAHD